MVASIQQHEESAIISVGSKKRHENNKTILLERKTTKARQTRLTTKKPKLTRKKITGGRPGKEGGYAAGEDDQSTLKSQSQCSDRLDQTE